MQRFSTDFDTADMMDGNFAEGADISNGGVWQQNRHQLETYKNSIAMVEENLRSLTGGPATPSEKLDATLDQINKPKS